jgi:hypothetical protein
MTQDHDDEGLDLLLQRREHQVSEDGSAVAVWTKNVTIDKPRT